MYLLLIFIFTVYFLLVCYAHDFSMSMCVEHVTLCCVLSPPSGRSSTGKVIETSVAILAEYAQQMMELIFSSVDQCPGLLRMALRQLWARVADRFTGPENTVREQS